MERSADQRLRTTEWEDIQYKFGNRVGKYATHELELLAQRLSDTHQDACLQSYDAEREAHEAKVARGGYDCLSEDDDKGDDARHAQTLTAPPSSSTNAAGGKPLPTNDSSEEDEDDDALMAIRRRRLAELQKQKQLNQFGVLRHIPGSAYVDEVTHASRMNWVVAVLMEPGQSQSEALLQVLRTVAQRQPAVKFVSMIATEAIANFPSRHVPCVLLYHKENLVQRMMGLEDWQPQGAKGGLTVSGVELILRRCGVLPRDEDEEDPSTDASR